MQLHRTAIVLASTSLLMACFGDNTEDQGGPGPGGGDAPSILDIAGPEDADVGNSLDLTVKVKGKANEQLSVAVDGGLGTFSLQNKVVITDDLGEGAFTTLYTSGTAGLETITANVSALNAAGSSATKMITIHGVERQGNIVPLTGAAVAPQRANVAIAYPVVLSTARVVSKLGIVHPTQPTTTPPTPPTIAHVALYSTETVSSIRLITNSTATLAAGANEIPIEPTSLEAGSYWMVVAYSGSPNIYRGASKVMKYQEPHDFAAGLPNVLADLVTSDNLTNPFADRNFYLVLRK
jgi:hypothetical protein